MPYAHPENIYGSIRKPKKQSLLGMVKTYLANASPEEKLVDAASFVFPYGKTVKLAKPAVSFGEAAVKTAVSHATEIVKPFVKYIGEQETVSGVPVKLFNLFNVPGHKSGTTVTENTLKKLGLQYRE